MVATFIVGRASALWYDDIIYRKTACRRLNKPFMAYHTHAAFPRDTGCARQARLAVGRHIKAVTSEPEGDLEGAASRPFLKHGFEIRSDLRRDKSRPRVAATALPAHSAERTSSRHSPAAIHFRTRSRSTAVTPSKASGIFQAVTTSKESPGSSAVALFNGADTNLHPSALSRGGARFDLPVSSRKYARRRASSMPAASASGFDMTFKTRAERTVSVRALAPRASSAGRFVH
jgi:hypothetical protein